MVDKSGRAGLRTRIKTADQPRPYEEYEGSALWKVVDRAVADPVNNGDIEEKTHRSYSVGYICKSMSAKAG
jgi:hypothetical protein